MTYYHVVKYAANQPYEYKEGETIIMDSETDEGIIKTIHNELLNIGENRYVYEIYISKKKWHEYAGRTYSFAIGKFDYEKEKDKITHDNPQSR